MKKLRVFKAFGTIITILLNIISIGLFSYALILYKGVETFYRIFGIIICIYLLILMSYFLTRSIRKKNLKSFFIPFIITLIFILIELAGYYYLNKIYKTIDSYSSNEMEYKSNLVSYKLKDKKELNDKKIGIITDTSDYEGNILPLEIIDKLKLKKNNQITEYNSTMELLHALKNNDVDAAFFSSNYVDMFYSIEGYENIESETNVLYSESKVYKIKTEEKASSTLDKPFSMLLIGVDSSKDGVTSGNNADVLLVATFNPKTLRATLTSIPRDMYMKTACSGNSYRRVNTVTWGSSNDCAVKTVENLFGIDIDYYAKINFKGVVSLVDSVDGIDVDVPYSFCENNSSRKWGKNTVYVEKGKQHLNGEQALALARNRHYPNEVSKMKKYCPELNEGPRSDFVRGKNQMKVILGLAKSASKLTDPNQIIDILETIKANFQTNISSKDALSLYDLGKSLFTSNTFDLLTIQRMQLSGYDMWNKIYESENKYYPAVFVPYKGSINDIKHEININLGKENTEPIKKISFDLNKLYEETVIGNGKYNEKKIATLKNLSNMSVSEIKSYASNNNLNVRFIDVDTNSSVDIYDYSEYYFYSQKEHVDIILELLDSITVYVKKRMEI